MAKVSYKSRGTMPFYIIEQTGIHRQIYQDSLSLGPTKPSVLHIILPATYIKLYSQHTVIIKTPIFVYSFETLNVKWILTESLSYSVENRGLPMNIYPGIYYYQNWRFELMLMDVLLWMGMKKYEADVDQEMYTQTASILISQSTNMHQCKLDIPLSEISLRRIHCQFTAFH